MPASEAVDILTNYYGDHAKFLSPKEKQAICKAINVLKNTEE